MPTILLDGDAIVYNDPTGREWEVAEIARFSVCPDGGSAAGPGESGSDRRGHPTGCLLRFRSRGAPAEERLAPGQPTDWLGPAQLERAWRSSGPAR